MKKFKKMIEWAKEPMLAVLTASLIIGFIVSHVKIPTMSMETTIMTGDHLLVNRLPYYYRDPKRGEVVVFAYEGDYLIKRVVGVPGDNIDIKNGKVHINGEVYDESEYLSDDVQTHIKAGSKISFPYTVPANEYFLMGDNRSNSKDGRVFGTVSRKLIFAKAGIRILPIDNIGKIQ